MELRFFQGLSRVLVKRQVAVFVAGALIASSCAPQIRNPSSTLKSLSQVSTTDHLAFLVEPSNTQINSAITPAVSVEFLNSNGVLDTGATGMITLAIANNAGPGGVLSGTLTVGAVNGVATFSNLSINVAGNGYTLSASSGSMVGATSSTFNISAVVAQKLVFTTEPSSAQSGASLGSIAVAVEDNSGNIATSSAASVTLAIGNNAGPGGVLSGTVTVSAVNGVATFPGLSIDLDGTGYTLTAAAGGLVGATSSAFDISSAAASKLVFGTEPASAQSGASLGSITVKVEDAAGNVVTSSTLSITLAIGTNAGPGGVLSGTATVSAISGIATFPGLNICRV